MILAVLFPNVDNSIGRLGCRCRSNNLSSVFLYLKAFVSVPLVLIYSRCSAAYPRMALSGKRSRTTWLKSEGSSRERNSAVIYKGARNRMMKDQFFPLLLLMVGCLA